MFQYDFMQHALMAILLASIIGGIMGYLILLRRLAFAAHGLGHISFTGATLALLLQISPIFGQFLSTLSAGFLIGLLGNSVQKRDITIAVVLSLMLGLGMLFLHFFCCRPCFSAAGLCFLGPHAICALLNTAFRRR